MRFFGYVGPFWLLTPRSWRKIGRRCRVGVESGSWEHGWSALLPGLLMAHQLVSCQEPRPSLCPSVGSYQSPLQRYKFNGSTGPVRCLLLDKRIAWLRFMSKGPPEEIIQKFRLSKWPISSADFPMTPMERTEHHFGPFWEKDLGAISGGPFFSRPLWFTADNLK